MCLSIALSVSLFMFSLPSLASFFTALFSLKYFLLVCLSVSVSVVLHRSVPLYPSLTHFSPFLILFICLSVCLRLSISIYLSRSSCLPFLHLPSFLTARFRLKYILHKRLPRSTRLPHNSWRVSRLCFTESSTKLKALLDWSEFFRVLSCF